MNTKYFIVAVLLCWASWTARAQENIDPAVEEWVRFNSWCSESVEGLIRRALPEITRFAATTELSPKCTSSLLKLIFGVRSMKNWAIRMLDSSGRPPAGILDGTLSDLGSMDQCFAVVNIDESGKELFRGQHCAVNLRPYLPVKPRHVTFKSKIIDLTNHSEPDTVFTDLSQKAPFFYRVMFRLGVCVPSTCSPEDVQLVFSEVLKDTFFNATVPYCQQPEGWELDSVQVVILSLLGIVLCLVLVGSITHRTIPVPSDENKEVLPLRILRCFSVHRNYKRMVEDSSTRSLDVLDGIRVLSMLWIILVHTYAFQHDRSMGRIMEIIDFARFISFGVIVNAWVSVDGFFLIGGVLVAYTTLKSLDRKNGEFNFPRYVLRRIWRLAPAIYLTTALLFLLPLIDRGPNWPETIGAEVSRCRQLWWMPLFLLNTWGDFYENCMIHTWYVSADLHLYVLAALPIYLLYKWPKLGVWCCVFLIFASSIITALITFIYDIYPTILFLSPDLDGIAEVGTQIYLRPFSHLAPYAIGLLVGYRLKEKGSVRNISKVVVLLGWLISIALISGVLFSCFKWHNGEPVLRPESALYAGLHRTVWGIGVGWIVFACSTGLDGGFIRPILSWRLFRRISHLTYLMYLIHLLAIWQRNASRRERFYLRHYDFIYEFFGNVMTAFLGAFVLHMLVEAPFAALDKVIFPEVNRFKEEQSTDKAKQLSPSYLTKNGPQSSRM